MVFNPLQPPISLQSALGSLPVDPSIASATPLITSGAKTVTAGDIVELTAGMIATSPAESEITPATKLFTTGSKSVTAEEIVALATGAGGVFVDAGGTGKKCLARPYYTGEVDDAGNDIWGWQLTTTV